MNNTENTEQQIANFLLPFNDDIRSLAQQLRIYLKKETKPIIEMVFDSYNSVNIGYGFTTKAWDCYCGIVVYSKHINLSFPSGAFLTDPQKLLQGTGSKIRHIKISRLGDVKQAAFKELLLEARNNALKLAKEGHTKQDEIKTVIKLNPGKKRRPK